MRIIVTGASGFLAGYLIEELLENGHEAVLLSRGEGARHGIPFTATDYSADSLRKILEDGADGIAHLASTRKVADSLSAYGHLIGMTEQLYQAAMSAGISNIVYTSSISVYSGGNLPYREEEAPKPANRYGLYKEICEKLGEFYNRTQGACVKNLRLAHLYGANEQNDYMINRFFRQAYAHEQLSVLCVSRARREMMYAKDAARAIRLALEQPDLSGTFNAGSGEALTTEEIARTVCAVMSPELEILKGSAEETIQSSYMDSRKAMESFGFQAAYPFGAAVREIMTEMGRF